MGNVIRNPCVEKTKIDTKDCPGSRHGLMRVGETEALNFFIKGGHSVNDKHLSLECEDLEPGLYRYYSEIELIDKD